MSYTIQYRDRRGVPIDHAAWRRLFDDLAYSRLAKKRAGPWEVELSWVGAVGSFEREPKLFLLVCKPATEKNAQTIEGWYATEAAAWEGHAAALEAAWAA